MYVLAEQNSPPLPPTAPHLLLCRGFFHPLEPHTSVVISSEPLCRSTTSWQLVPRNSMVVVEGGGPVTVNNAATDATGGKDDDDTVVVADAHEDSSSVGSGTTASAPDDENGDLSDASAPPARKEAVGLGLVSSIKYEPLRCHPSDAPAMKDPALSD